MTEQSLKERISDAVKDAMRARDKERLATLRQISAELKRVEVDERVDLDDERILHVLDKMVKQRRDSIEQYRAGGRDELADKEQAEIDVIQEFLPAALTESELSELVAEAISRAGATSMQDMGKVMNELRPKVSGRADMGEVSQLVKEKLS